MNVIFSDTIHFGEFILDQHPNPKGVTIISQLLMIQNEIKNNGKISLDKNELEIIKQQAIAFYIGWNPEITKQSLEFYNTCVKINNITQFLFDKKNHPFSKILEELDRYEKGDQTVREILKKYDNKMIGETEFHHILFTIVIMAEAIEYCYYNPFKLYLKDFSIKDVDIDDIFSVRRKWINECGNYDSDIRMMRNAVAHYQYAIEYKSPPDELEITFFPHPKGKEESRRLYSTDLIRFIGTYRNLLQTFEHLLILMMTFTLINHYLFSKK